MKLFLNPRGARTWTMRLPLRFSIRFLIARFEIFLRSLPPCCSINATKNSAAWASSSNPPVRAPLGARKKFEPDRISESVWVPDLGFCRARPARGKGMCSNPKCQPEGRRYKSVSRTGSRTYSSQPPLQIAGNCSIAIFVSLRGISVVDSGASRLICLGGEIPLMTKSTGPQVTETPGANGTDQVFRPYERLVKIKILGKMFEVPEKNTILRCFQYISPETIPYGRFCWNQDCQYCRVTCQLPDEDEPHEMLSCKFIVMPGMEIVELSQELKWCLRAKLPADAAVTS